MILRNIKISDRLLIGFGIQIILILLIGILSLLEIRQTAQTFNDMHRHPFTVSNTVREINSNIIAMHRSMKDVALADNDYEMQLAVSEVNALELEVFNLLDIVFERYLGEKKDVEAVHQAFIDWRPIRNEVIAYWHQGKSAEAIAITKGKGAKHVKLLNQNVSKLIDFANNKAQNFQKQIIAHVRSVYTWFMILVLSSIMLSLVVIVLFSKSIIAPVKAMNNVADRVKEGDLTARNKVSNNDELTYLAGGINKMIDAISDRNRIQKVAGNIYQSVIGHSNLQQYCQSLSTCFDTNTEANCISIFQNNIETHKFENIYTFGCNSNIKQSHNAALPEGELEKLLHQKYILQLNNITPTPDLSYSTLINNQPIKSIISIPIIQHNKVEAIITLATISEFSQQTIEAINQSWIILNSSYSTLLGNEITRTLANNLKQSNDKLEQQRQELQNQSNELQEQNIELEMQRNQVEEANRLKSEFLSNMSHELRTPLNSILALSRVLIMQVQNKLNTEENQYLEIIERNGKNLLSLINEILDLSKIEAGKTDLELEPVSIKNAITNAIDNLQQIAEEKNLYIRRKMPDFDINVVTDAKRLHQIFINILGNALKFTKEGGITVELKDTSKSAIISIADTGIGIPEDEIPNIFDEFRQVDGSTSRNYEGTGLGLSITKKLIKALNGKIHVESKLGYGSVFTITLPKQTNITPTLADPIISDISYNEQNQKTILVVDDDSNSLTNISEYLSNDGFNIIKTSSGTEAIKLAQEHQPFAITLDIVMPEMDGFEVLHQLKMNPHTQHIPVVIVSVTNDSQTSFALGAVGFVQKPVSKDSLLIEIKKLIKRPKNILIVDDSEIDLLNYQNILNETNINITTKQSGAACIAQIQKELPDLLVLDLMMPEMDGFQVLNKIRNTPKSKNLPVIVVTAKELSHHDKNILKQQTTTVLSKSEIDGKQLIKSINNVYYSNEMKKNILIIEDNPTAILQIEKILTQNNYNVNIAQNGIEALNQLKTFTPDGIILDLMMPEMDGFEFLEKISIKKIPTTILTAKTLTKEDLLKLAPYKISYLIQKGDIEIDALLAKVKSMTSEGMKNNTIKNSDTKDKTLIEQESSKPVILLIEDNADNRVTVKAILGNEYKIIEAADGALGVEYANTYNPDLILCDISLPKMDGFEVLRKLKTIENTKQIPIIALTAKAMKNDKKSILSAGFNSYISKPINIDELKENVKFRLKK